MDAFGLFKDAYAGWRKHEVSRLAASLAYYAILSLAPLVIVVIGIAGVVFGAEAARQGLLTQIKGLVGSEGAQMVGTMISHASSPRSDVVTGLVGLLTLLFGASGVFVELHESLNKVWEVRSKPGQGFWAMLRERFLSFGMVLVIGFLLLVSLLLSAALAGIGKLFGHGLPALVLQGIDFIMSVVVITLLFAAIYRFLPSERLLGVIYGSDLSAPRFSSWLESFCWASIWAARTSARLTVQQDRSLCCSSGYTTQLSYSFLERSSRSLMPASTAR